VSARPFTVLGEYGPPAFQRGVLHVYFPAMQLHVFVVHLHAHSSQQRIAEAHALVQVGPPMLQRVIVAFQSEFPACVEPQQNDHRAVLSHRGSVSTCSDFLLLTFVVQVLKPHLEAGERVALMGDFNTLSRHDSRQHEDARLPQMLRRTDLQVRQPRIH
jgi:endonuclease/exonuclease/phosphatase family metal-dependent hydrolase